MKLSQAITAIKNALYALFVYREEEGFRYNRDVEELTAFTFSMPKKDQL